MNKPYVTLFSTFNKLIILNSQIGIVSEITKLSGIIKRQIYQIIFLKRRKGLWTARNGGDTLVGAGRAMVSGPIDDFDCTTKDFSMLKIGQKDNSGRTL